MLQVYEFDGAWGLPSASPFCVKLTTWLRMAGIEYERRVQASPFGMPKGKVPYVVDEGRKLGDSGFIIEHLTKARGVLVDAHLDDEQRGLSHALRRTLEESLYFVILYERWLTDEGWALTKPAYFGVAPPLLRDLVALQARRQVRGYCHGQGIGRHSLDDARRIGLADLACLTSALGDKPHLFGELSTLDATAFAFLWHLAAAPIPSPLRDRVTGDPRLMGYVERLRDRYWSE